MNTYYRQGDIGDEHSILQKNYDEVEGEWTEPAHPGGERHAESRAVAHITHEMYEVNPRLASTTSVRIATHSLLL